MGLSHSGSAARRESPLSLLQAVPFPPSVCYRLTPSHSLLQAAPAVAGCSRLKLKPWDIHPARRGIILPRPRVGLRGSEARLLHLRARPLRGRGAGVLKSPLCLPRCLH